MIWLVLAALAGGDLLRRTVDYVAMWRHWRVGRWGRILCLREHWPARRWGRRGGGCLHCRTDFRWAVPHDTPIREDGYMVFPLCDPCWQELTVDGRMPYYAAVISSIRQAREMDKGEWDELRVSVFAAVKAGL